MISRRRMLALNRKLGIVSAGSNLLPNFLPT